jgi:hypothetical protein
LRGDRAAALTDARRKADDLDAWQHVRPTDLPFSEVERRTDTFRFLKKREYLRKATERREEARAIAAQRAQLREDPTFEWDPCLLVLDARLAKQEAKAWGSSRFYQGRARGQEGKFDTIRACGTRDVKVSCLVCGTERTTVKAACGVIRLCARCVEDRARKRQRRIAQARARAIVNADLARLFRGNRRGGRWSEKHLVVTVPHVHMADVVEGSPVAKACDSFGLRTDVAARVATLFLAWPIFMRAVRRWYQLREGKGRAALTYWYRCFEWERGSDGLGHPHFHVQLLSPWFPKWLLGRLWADAIAKVGVACPRECEKCLRPHADRPCHYGKGNPHVIVSLDRCYGSESAQLRELIKSGNRRAIAALGTMGHAGAVVSYAGDWSMLKAFPGLESASDGEWAAAAALYCALEGRRLYQGSAGFLVAPKPCACGKCGASNYDGEHTVFAAALVDGCQKDEAGAA